MSSREHQSGGRLSRAALFGYDFFISFTLGPPPRGTQTYAADLARQLRALDYTVFFSEDEAPPGAVLDSTVTRALHRSRALILVANDDALTASKWTRAEVTEFRRRRPTRPVVPINVGTALEDRRDEAEPWLRYEQSIWINESMAAVLDGTASAATVHRLIVVPRTIRANNRMRATAAGVTLVLALLAAAIWFALDARAQQRSLALSRQIAARSLDEANRSWSRSILLALAAPLVGDSVEARSALFTAMASVPTSVRFLWGHQKSVRTVAFSPDGKLLASASEDGAVRLWDPFTGAAVGEPMKAPGSVISVAFSPDGQLLASAGAGGVILWDVATRRALTAPTEGRFASSVAFRPNGDTVLSAEGDGSIVFNQVVDRTLIPHPVPAHDQPALSVAFHPGGVIFASGSAGNDVFLWNIATQRRFVLKGHTAEVVSLAFSPDGRLLASGSSDESVIVWDVRTHEPVASPLRGLDGIVMGLAFAPNGGELVASSYDDRVIAWDVQTFTRHVEPLGHRQRDGVSSVAFSPDGTLLASGGGDASVIVASLGKPGALGERLDAGFDALSSVAFSPDGNVIAAGTATNTVRMWDRRTGTPVGAPLAGHDGIVMSVAFRPQGDLLASSDELGRVILWNVSSRTPVGEPLWGHPGPVSTVAFSPDGDRLASGGEDGKVVLWDPLTRMPVGDPLTMPGDDNVIDMAFSRDGGLFASAGKRGLVMVWDVATRQPVGSPLSTGGISVQGLAFSPDTRMLAAVTNSRTVLLWDVAGGHALDPVTAEHANLLSVAFSPDGRLLALASGERVGAADNKVVLVDVATRRRLGELRQPSAIYKIAFSPDSLLLATASEGDGVTLWHVDDASWRAIACTTVNRTLTPSEWQALVGDIPFHPVCPERPVSSK